MTVTFEVQVDPNLAPAITEITNTATLTPTRRGRSTLGDRRRHPGGGGGRVQQRRLRSAGGAVTYYHDVVNTGRSTTRTGSP